MRTDHVYWGCFQCFRLWRVERGHKLYRFVNNLRDHRWHWKVGSQTGFDPCKGAPVRLQLEDALAIEAAWRLGGETAAVELFSASTKR